MEQASLLGGGARIGGSSGSRSTGLSSATNIGAVAICMVGVACLLSTTAFVSQEWMVTKPDSAKHEPASVGLFLICQSVSADAAHGDEMDCQSLNDVRFPCHFPSPCLFLSHSIHCLLIDSVHTQSIAC